jgi:outer membrane protein
LLAFLLPAAAGAREPRIGIVDMPKLFSEYPGTKAAQVRYDAVARERERALAEDEKVLRRRRGEHDRIKGSMDAAARKSAERELERMARDLAKRRQAYLDEMRDREASMSKAVVEEIRALVAKAAKKRRLDLVLDREKVVYAQDAVDLTAELLGSFGSTDERERH